MNIRNLIPTALIATGSILSSCGGKSPTKKIPQFINDPKFTTILADTFSKKITDENKIIEYNKILKKYGQNVDNYIIIDKKNCVAKVYNPDGNLLYSNEVALGRNIGDKRSGGYLQPKVPLAAYTTPGEYVISKEGAKVGSKDYKLYGERVLVLSGDHTKEISKGKQTLALHRIPTSPMGRLRQRVLKNRSKRDNRVSFGCVNYLVETFDKMRSLIKGVSTKVYILPEEKGNSLYLEQQADGTFKFFQKKYRFESQENLKR